MITFLETLPQTGCSIRDKYGIYCPGCGGTRAVKALLQLDIIKSIYYNPIPFSIVVFVIGLLIVFLLEKRNGRKALYFKIKSRLCLMVLIVIVLNFLVKNYFLIFQDIDLLGNFF